MDSWVYTMDIANAIDDFTFNKEDIPAERRELMYWRKHHDLHKWMKRLFIQKGGDVIPNQFNCDYVRLVMEDIERLEQDMHWVDEDPSCYENDMDFIQMAKRELNDGKALYFSSWY